MSSPAVEKELKDTRTPREHEVRGVQDNKRKWRVEWRHTKSRADGSERDHQQDKAGRELQTESMKYYTGVPDVQQAQHIQN